VARATSSLHTTPTEPLARSSPGTTDGLRVIDRAIQYAIDHNDARITGMIAPRADDDEDLEFDQNDHGQAVEDYETGVQRAIGLDFTSDPTHIVHWAGVFGSCHWFNRWIGHYLACKVCPDQTWYVLKT
jgi:hypothetical protein